MIITKAEKRGMKKKLVSTSLSPPWLSFELVPIPEGPIPLPIPPNTPGMELYGKEVVVPLVVAVPAVLYRKRDTKGQNVITRTQSQGHG